MNDQNARHPMLDLGEAGLVIANNNYSAVRFSVWFGRNPSGNVIYGRFSRVSSMSVSVVYKFLLFVFLISV